MAYCTSANVQSEFKNLVFSATSTVQSAECDDFIAQADARINSILGARYVVPVTGTTALLIVKTFSIRIVTNRIKRILAIRAGLTELETFAEEDTEIEDALKEFASGEATLVDAVLLVSGGGVASYNVDNEITQTIDPTDQQW